MRTTALAIAIVCITAILTISVLNCASTPKPEDVKTALAVANEACDVVVLLDDDATRVCVPIEQVEAIARTVLRSTTKAPVDVPEDVPRIRVLKTRVRIERIEQTDGGTE